MYEQFGAVVDGQDVEFRLFFPDNARDPTQYVRGGLPRIREIRVRGNFQGRIGGQDWELASAPLMTRIAHPRLYMDPADSPYIGPFARGGFFEEFDYNNGCVQEFIRDVCIYWLDEFQVDGIRFDFFIESPVR